jgi:hypothetical protein
MNDEKKLGHAIDLLVAVLNVGTGKVPPVLRDQIVNLVGESKTVYRVALRCLKCGEGNLDSTGEETSSEPVLYMHVCDHCGAETLETERYPRDEVKDSV